MMRTRRSGVRYSGDPESRSIEESLENIEESLEKTEQAQRETERLRKEAEISRKKTKQMILLSFGIICLAVLLDQARSKKA